MDEIQLIPVESAAEHLNTTCVESSYQIILVILVLYKLLCWGTFSGKAYFKTLSKA